MLRKSLVTMVALLFAVGTMLAAEYEATLVKYSSKDKEITVKVEGKEKTF